MPDNNTVLASKNPTTTTVSGWAVVELPHAFAGSPTKLRLQVTYSTGIVRILAPAFNNRAGLDRYVARFLPDLVGKEIL